MQRRQILSSQVVLRIDQPLMRNSYPCNAQFIFSTSQYNEIIMVTKGGVNHLLIISEFFFPFQLLTFPQFILKFGGNNIFKTILIPQDDLLLWYLLIIFELPFSFKRFIVPQFILKFRGNNIFNNILILQDDLLLYPSMIYPRLGILVPSTLESELRVLTRVKSQLYEILWLPYCNFFFLYTKYLNIVILSIKKFLTSIKKIRNIIFTINILLQSILKLLIYHYTLLYIHLKH